MSIEFEYEENDFNFLTQFELTSGTWLFRIWGAQGGYVNNDQGGRGSYSEAIYITNSTVKLYSFVGAHGMCSNTVIPTKSFSGGSNAIGSRKYLSCTGGEATFISKDPAANDILLLSGAGGGSGINNREFIGGYGGPFAGDSEGQADWIEEATAKKVRGKGATSKNPGNGGFYAGYGYPSCTASQGFYLAGGSAATSAAGSSGGGGAGYYGGGGGADVAGGGGGSSFASNEMYNNIILLGGNKIFLSPNDEVEIGHSGHGFIRIEPSKPYTFQRADSNCQRIAMSCDFKNIHFSYFLLSVISSHFSYLMLS